MNVKKYFQKNKNELIALGLITLFFIKSDIILLLLYSFNVDITKFNDKTIEIFGLISSIIYTCLIIIIYRKELYNCLKNIKKNFRSYLETAVPAYIFGIIIMIISNLIIQLILGMGLAENEQLVRSSLQNQILMTIVSACILAPVCEEMVFRKMFKDIFKNKIFFVIFSGLVFGGLHVIGAITSWYDLLYIIPYSSLGIAFAYIYAKTDNILVPMTCHFVHNSFSVVMLILSMFVGA